MARSPLRLCLDGLQVMLNGIHPFAHDMIRWHNMFVGLLAVSITVCFPCIESRGEACEPMYAFVDRDSCWWISSLRTNNHRLDIVLYRVSRRFPIEVEGYRLPVLQHEALSLAWRVTGEHLWILSQGLIVAQRDAILYRFSLAELQQRRSAMHAAPNTIFDCRNEMYEIIDSGVHPIVLENVADGKGPLDPVFVDIFPRPNNTVLMFISHRDKLEAWKFLPFRVKARDPRILTGPRGKWEKNWSVDCALEGSFHLFKTSSALTVIDQTGRVLEGLVPGEVPERKGRLELAEVRRLDNIQLVVVDSSTQAGYAFIPGGVYQLKGNLLIEPADVDLSGIRGMDVSSVSAAIARGAARIREIGK